MTTANSATKLRAMKVIGLTGGIGSGKSAVATFLKELGAEVIDADKVGHEVFLPGTPGWQEVVETYGKEILAANGSIDRKKLSAIVFNNPQALEKLNRIMHPRIYNEVRKRLEEYRGRGVKVAVIEAPLLIEAGWSPLVEEIWVKVAPKEKVIQRVCKDRNLSEAEIVARINSQSSTEEKIKHATVVIKDEETLEELKNRVKQLWEELTAKS